jgi:hypothetical protein
MQDVLERLRKKHPEVTSVGLGYKYVGGIRTNRLAIVIGVAKKRSALELKTTEFLPGEVDGILTDVRQFNFRARILGDIPISYRGLTPLEFTEKRRPCPAGFSVGHKDITAGTFGVPIVRNGKLGALSNAHVLANSNDGAIGDDIYQPGPHDGGTIVDRWARLDATVAINPGGGQGCTLGGIPWPPWGKKKARERLEQPDPNRVDCAFAEALKPEYIEKLIYRVGPVRGFINPQLGWHVRKVGRTSEVTHALVDQLQVSSVVDYGSFYANFTNQALFSGLNGANGAFSAPGDSGSGIVTEDNDVCALLFAGGQDETGRDVTLGNVIEDVLEYLGHFEPAS